MPKRLNIIIYFDIHETKKFFGEVIVDKNNRIEREKFSYKKL